MHEMFVANKILVLNFHGWPIPRQYFSNENCPNYNTTVGTLLYYSLSLYAGICFGPE